MTVTNDSLQALFPESSFVPVDTLLGSVLLPTMTEGKRNILPICNEITLANIIRIQIEKFDQGEHVEALKGLQGVASTYFGLQELANEYYYSLLKTYHKHLHVDNQPGIDTFSRLVQDQENIKIRLRDCSIYTSQLINHLKSHTS